MKNLMKISVLIIVLLGMVLSGCKKQEIVKEKIDYDSVGYFHNKALDYCLNNNIGKFSEIGEEQFFSENIDLIAKYLEQTNCWNQNEIKFGKEQAIIYMNSIVQENKGNSDFENFFDDFDKLKESLVENLHVSDLFITELSLIYNKSKSGASPEEVKNHIDTVFSKIKWTTIEDKQTASIFVDVFNHSYIYWTSSSSKLKKSSWVMIHDGMGAIFGSAFTAIGSIILGTAWSVYSNETLPEGNY